VLVLDNENAVTPWPMDDDNVPGYAWDRIGATMLDDASLAGKDIVIMNMLCNPKFYLGKGQTDSLLKWVAAGHELLITDADQCQKGTRYDFLPYPFAASNPGAKGAASKALIVVESDVLGSTDDQDTTHYFDPKTFVNGGSNQIGDANTVTTSDPHWCGHLFGTNVLNVNGFMQMYAPYAKGVRRVRHRARSRRDVRARNDADVAVHDAAPRESGVEGARERDGDGRQRPLRDGDAVFSRRVGGDAIARDLGDRSGERERVHVHHQRRRDG